VSCGAAVGVHHQPQDEPSNDRAVSALYFYDRSQMMYFLKKHGEKDIKVSKIEYYKQGYGFAVSTNSPLSRKINILLLNLSEQNRINRIVQAWLGDENKDM
jgi:polar amino acid transport system substrate-binding protein